MNKTIYNISEITSDDWQICEPIANYCNASRLRQLSLFPSESLSEPVFKSSSDINVIELFAGVGGFRVGLERASKRFKTIWNNQWEPSTKRQDASMIYCERFGDAGHSNRDIATVSTDEIPSADLLVGGFPCQDYSVATTLKQSGGIEGNKGVLWWQIYRIIKESKQKPKFLMLENVDRLLKSPAKQRGRDFAIILASLSDLGYAVEWRVINAAEYGMPQRRRRTYIVAYRYDQPILKRIINRLDWVVNESIMAKAFPVKPKDKTKVRTFKILGELSDVTMNFNKGKVVNSFENAGIMMNREVLTLSVDSEYDGPSITLGDIILPESQVPEEYFVSPKDLPRWLYLKGSKSETRKTSDGYEYQYSEGSMAFPDKLDAASRTIITGEGGGSPSRFKHIIMTRSGRYRRLTPLELERLNMFPDCHTEGLSPVRRAFLMGNALVTGIVEKIGLQLCYEL